MEPAKVGQYILYGFNFLIVIGAITVIALGAVYVTDATKGIIVLNTSVGGIGIAVSVIVLIVAALGVVAAIKRNSCLLLTYAIILSILFFAQLGVGALAVSWVQDRDDPFTVEEIDKIFEEAFDSYASNPTDQGKLNDIQTIQEGFECCGVTGPDWYDRNPDAKPAQKFCHDYTQGCSLAYRQSVYDTLGAFGGVALGFAVVEFLAVAAARALRKQATS